MGISQKKNHNSDNFMFVVLNIKTFIIKRKLKMKEKAVKV